MCLTKGQWLQMNITSSARAPAKSDSAIILPSGSGSLKFGALVPSGLIVDGVATIR
jgi:hypothetical protein